MASYLYASFRLFSKKLEMSKLPPEMIATVFFPTNLLSFKMAASTIDPENYTTIFIRSMKSFPAEII